MKFTRHTLLTLLTLSLLASCGETSEQQPPPPEQML